MLEAIVSDVIGVFNATFLTGDWTALLVAVASVLIAAIMMQRGTQIGSMTLLALTLFVIGCFVRVFLMAPDPANSTAAGNRIVAQMEASWLEFSTLQAGTILAYFIAFMLLILVMFGVKAMLSRG